MKKKRERKTKPTTFLGYCSRCKCMIMEADKISAFIYQCPSCGKTERTKYLKQETTKKYKSRRRRASG